MFSPSLILGGRYKILWYIKIAYLAEAWSQNIKNYIVESNMAVSEFVLLQQSPTLLPPAAILD